MNSSTRDRGQAAVLLVVMATVLFVALSAASVTVGRRIIDRTRAQTAADAAALASLEGGPAAALRLAERHGATLVSVDFEPGSHRVSVVVSVGSASARADATDAP